MPDTHKPKIEGSRPTLEEAQARTKHAAEIQRKAQRVLDEAHALVAEADELLRKATPIQHVELDESRRLIASAQALIGRSGVLLERIKAHTITRGRVGNPQRRAT